MASENTVTSHAGHHVLVCSGQSLGLATLGVMIHHDQFSSTARKGSVDEGTQIPKLEVIDGNE